METNQTAIDALNDLIRINNDRIEGYEKAIKDSGDDKSNESLFNRMIDQSNSLRQQLMTEVMNIGGEAEKSETTNSGKIYRVWMDIKSAVAGKSELSVLELCEYGEDAAQKAYKEALAEADKMTDSTRELIVRQKAELKESHDLVKAKRDMHKVTNE